MRNPFRRKNTAQEGTILTTEQLLQLWERFEEEFDGRAKKAMTISPVSAAISWKSTGIGSKPNSPASVKKRT